ncbi:zinc finger, CCHC-type containing protein [Tanacetum coccineum]
MTTSSANNSVFRGFFEKQKLTKPNFIDWYRQLRIVLSIDDKLNYLEQPLPPAPVAPAGQHVAPEILAAHTAWVKGSKEIAGLMLMTMEPEIQRNLENLHANDMLKELKALFAQQAEQELLQTTRDFHACKQEEGQSVSSYVLKMKGYIDNLERLGHPVTLGLAVSLILIGLRKEFDGFVQNYNMHSLGKTKGKKHNKPQPQKAARGQNQGNGKNKHAYAPKPKIPPPPKREDPAKDLICHECGETGHWKRNCPQYLAELLKTKKLSQGASGSGFKEVVMKARSLSLYVGNGQRAAVEAMGTYHLCHKDTTCPDGMCLYINAKELELEDLDIRAIRIFIAIVAYYDYEIWQIDVKTAFLNGHLLEEVLQRLDLGGLIEAEYISAYDASKEAVWVRKFIFGLGVVPTIEEPINIYYDNTGAITIANESGITKGAIHFRAKVHYLHEVIEYGDELENVTLETCSTY